LHPTKRSKGLVGKKGVEHVYEKEGGGCVVRQGEKKKEFRGKINEREEKKGFLIHYRI